MRRRKYLRPELHQEDNRLPVCQDTASLCLHVLRLRGILLCSISHNPILGKTGWKPDRDHTVLRLWNIRQFYVLWNWNHSIGLSGTIEVFQKFLQLDWLPLTFLLLAICHCHDRQKRISWHRYLIFTDVLWLYTHCTRIYQGFILY